MSDSSGDGTPDFLRLEAGDREAFRRWFTFLAEAAAALPEGERPPEVNDCAGLIRFAYREALREHTGEWAGRLRLPLLPENASGVSKYHYPLTPLGANLFRIAPGSFTEADLRNGAFAQFADAETLLRRNTHFRSRDLERAEAGDLLFFHRHGQSMPYHAMIVAGRSQLTASPERWLVYHTGPEGHDPGEIRRVTYTQLQNHPSPQWRPVAGNSNFLGVYRWNILRESE